MPTTQHCNWTSTKITFKNKYLFEYNGTISPFFISFIFVQIFPAKQGRLKSILSCFANVSDLVKQLRDVFCTIFHYYHNYDLEIIDEYLQASCFCIPDAEKERVNTKFFEFNIRPELLFLCTLLSSLKIEINKLLHYFYIQYSL